MHFLSAATYERPFILGQAWYVVTTPDCDWSRKRAPSAHPSTLSSTRAAAPAIWSVSNCKGLRESGRKHDVQSMHTRTLIYLVECMPPQMQLTRAQSSSAPPTRTQNNQSPTPVNNTRGARGENACAGGTALLCRGGLFVRTAFCVQFAQRSAVNKRASMRQHVHAHS